MAGPEDRVNLSESANTAFKWAAAAARARAEQKGKSSEDVEIDEFDLLVGLMLSDPIGCEPRALVEHVGATAADLLPADYPMPTADVLERHISTVGANGAIAMTPDVAGALVRASTYGYTELVEPRAAFGGLLQSDNQFAVAVRNLLAKVGLPGVIESYEEYLGEGQVDVSQNIQTGIRPARTYAEFLRELHPFRAEPVEVPTYKPDHGPGSMGDDYVDIRAEVDAFAYLLASRALQPPLAVGLFGDWGSGKSYFMDALRSRIEQLVRSDGVAEQPQKEVPFWKRVIQIDFNAWHYVDGDLWASLVEHVFSQLKAHDNEKQTEVAKRQRYWLDKIDEKLRERGDLELATEEKAADLETAQTALAEAERRRDIELRTLAEAEQKAAAGAVLTTSLVPLKAALAGLLDADQLRPNADDALAAVEEARTELTRGLGIVRGLGLRHAFVVAAVPVLVWLLGEIELPGAAQVFGGISALLAAVTAALRGATGQVRARLDKLDQATAAIHEEADAQRQTLAADVERAREKVEQATVAVDELAAKRQTLEAEIAHLGDRVAGVTSGALLSEFVTERVGSVDYRTRLGTAALVQRDFRALSKLIDEQNDECLAQDTGGAPGPEVLNRIILYVDDLDRCEAKRVVEVLQAVHLLLAFPLFVVVVAVDSRWLSQSLEQHYPALVNGPGAEQATPSDYLEKIFQVPFWVEPLGPSARGSMVRGLLQGNLRGTSGGDDVVDEADALVVDDRQREMIDALFTHRTAIKMQTAALTVTADELRFLDGLGSLLGVTPRSIKRFVNVYQLLCGLPPVPLGPDTPPYEELVAFLLAVTDGLPDLIVELRKRLAEKVDGETLAGAIGTIRLTVPAPTMARYDAWIAEHAGWDAFPLADLAIPAERVRRFSFR